MDVDVDVVVVGGVGAIVWSAPSARRAAITSFTIMGMMFISIRHMSSVVGGREGEWEEEGEADGNRIDDHAGC